MCRGFKGYKKPYYRKEDAQSDADKMNQKFSPQKFTHYFCNVCGCWHVGSTGRVE